jgi:Flp pilus assembly protein TadG
MRAKCIMTRSRGVKARRYGVAAVEYAVFLPLILTVLGGLWEVGRITEVQTVMWNSAREAARDASLGEDDLPTVTGNLLVYLQGAEKTAFPSGHTTSIIAPVISLPANTTGYTCWDNTANKELFTITFADLTATSVTDPTDMSQLDVYQIGVSVPYSSIQLNSFIPIAGISRLAVNVVWASLVDSPFQIAPYLPAQ